MINEDHDKVIRFETQLKDFEDSTLEKLKTFQDELLKLTAQIRERLDEVAQKETATEQFIGGMHYSEAIKTVQDDHEWIHDFRTSWKVIHVILGILYTILGVIISLIATHLGSIQSMFRFP